MRELGVRAGLHPRRNRDGSCDARCVVIEAMRDAGYVEVPVDKLIQIRMSKGRHLSQEESAGNAAALEVRRIADLHEASSRHSTRTTPQVRLDATNCKLTEREEFLVELIGIEPMTS